MDDNPLPLGTLDKKGTARVVALASQRDRIRRRRWTQFQAACAGLLLCAGLVIAPFVAALDLGVWAACRDVDRRGCFDIMARATVQLQAAEMGATD